MKCFDEIYNEHFDFIFCSALKHLSHEDAEDIVVDTFIAYWINRHKVELGKEKNFLITILFNRIKDIRKSKRARKTQLFYHIELVADQFPDEQDSHLDHLLIILSVAINKLNKVPKKILLLYLQGYETGQIAKMTGKSPQSVYNQKTSAIKVLREYLQPYM